MSEPLRVCQVVNAVDTTSVPADIATALAEHTPVDSGILAWFHADGFDGDETVDVHCLDAPDTTLGVSVDVLRDLRSVLSEYDVVQTHHNHSGAFAKPVAALQGKTVISTEQNTHDGFTTKGLAANALTNPLADRVTCVSGAVWDSFLGWEKRLLDEEKVEIIYNGVDLERIDRAAAGSWSVYDVADVNQDATLVANAAMMSEQKAQDSLIRAVARARDRGEELELAIAGDGELREYLRGVAADSGVADSVHFLGLLDRTEVYQLFAEADVYAMPSRWEGYCVAVVEAMAQGTPTVLSSLDVFQEVYGDAALYHDVDDVGALAEVLASFSSDPELRAEYSDRATELAERYSMQNIATQYYDLYREFAD